MSELRVFREARRTRAKRPCPPGFMFCLKCREPLPSAERMIDYAPLAATTGNLIGLCPKCSGLMLRRFKQADVARIQAALTGGADAPIAPNGRRFRGDYLSLDRNRRRAREQFLEGNSVYKQLQEARAAAEHGSGPRLFEISSQLIADAEQPKSRA